MEAPDLILLVRLLRHRSWVGEDQLEIALDRLASPLSASDLLDDLEISGALEASRCQLARQFVRGRLHHCCRSPEEQWSVDRSFGQIAISRGWISVEQLESALHEQEQLRRIRLGFRLGEVFVRKGNLSVRQVREILRAQGISRSDCEACGGVMEEPTKNECCPQCGGDLRPSLCLDPVATDAEVPI